MFTLVKDNVGVEHVGKEHVDYLKRTLEENYEITSDQKGDFLGIDLDRDYSQVTVLYSMKNYIMTILQRFNHLLPKKLQHSPHPENQPTFGEKRNMLQILKHQQN